MSNPYEIRDCPAEEASGDDECEACPVQDCRQDEMRIVWTEAFNAGLEAAAEECDAEHDRLVAKKPKTSKTILQRRRDRFGRMLDEERALVCAQLADEIRAMKEER